MGAAKFAFQNYQNNLLKKVSVRTNTLLTKPMQVSIIISDRCNARCLMCNCWQEKNDYLTSADIIKALGELREWLGSSFFLQIAGGEPLIFDGIYDIFRFCAEADIVCKISTNGLSLNSESVCNKIIDSGLRYLSVSIDSHIPDVHDEYRGVKGTFEKGMKGLAYLRKNSSMVLGISSIIMKPNAPHLKAFIDFLLSLDVDRFLFQPIRDYYENPFDVTKWHLYKYWPTDLEGVSRGIDFLIQKKREGEARLLNSISDFELIRSYFNDPTCIINTRSCYLGYDTISVNSKGDVFLCDAYGSIGNIKQGSIRSFWQNSTASALREEMVKCGLPCTSNCKKELSFQEKVVKFAHLYQAGLFGRDATTAR